MKVTGYIRSDSPRAARWREVFGGESVPLKGIMPIWIELEGPAAEEAGGRRHLAYEVAIDHLSPEQLQALIQHAARQSGMPEEEVAQRMRREGCPVLAADVTVSCDTPWML